MADGMTITTPVFESHMKYLHDNGYTVIPLRQLVDHYRGKAPAPKPKSVVIVEDDAHKSVYSDMLPVIRKYGYPVTVFTYPSAISNAKYAMTWEQLRELKRTGLFDIQSHTYWHPNFKRERKKMSGPALEQLVMTQLRKSKARLETELGVNVDMQCALKSLDRLDGWMDDRYRKIQKMEHPEEYGPSSIDAFYLYGRSFFKEKPVAAGKWRWPDMPS